MQRKFISDLVQELIKANKGRVEIEIILDMLEDVAVCFDNGNEGECTTNQHHISMKELFRGHITKD